MKRKVRKILILVAKLLVAAGLLALVLRKVHWSDYNVQVDGQDTLVRGFATTITQADPWLLAGAFAGFLIPLFILAFRWWYLLRVQQIRISLTEAVRLTFLGTFFNYVVPGSVSGDLVKAWYVSKHIEHKTAALVSVFVDRMLGLLEFVILPAVVIAGMYAVGADGTDRLTVPAVIVAVVLTGVILSMAVFFSPGFRRTFRLGKIISRLPFQRHIAVVAQAADLYRRRPTAVVKAVGITFVGQSLFIIAVMLAAFSLGLDISWYVFFLYIPLIYIIASVPVSPGGLGLVEAFYITFFATNGISPSEILAMALLARLMPMICSMPGIIVALTGPKLPSSEQIQAELSE